ncbi:MAG: CopG family transcriptional regulator [Polyangiaceae bacterium]|nr:CopG family transcriptional regulator [Polyangiaceae bacterium]
MRNLTVSLDEQVARWARVAAAQRDMSVSRFVAEVLRARMGEDQAYEAAMQRSLARQPRALKARGATYPTRDELHD